jgi:hypothetical protein
MYARVGKFWCRRRVFGLVLAYIYALVSRVKRAVAGRFQSKSGLLGEKMITFDDIGFSRVMLAGGMKDEGYPKGTM